MKQGRDISAEFPGLFLVHQKIKGHEKARHGHEDHEIFFPLQGEIQIDVEGQTLKAGPGRMLYVPAGAEHAFRSSRTGEGERLIAIVSRKLADQAGGFGSRARVRPSSQLSKELLFHLLLHPETKAAKSLIQTFVETVGEMLDMETVDGDTQTEHLSGRTGDERVLKALDVIESSFSESLSMEEVARASGLSARNLNRLFLEQIGIAPKQVLILKRINEAKRLLRQRRSVTDVALDVGYSSVSQFIVTFRRVTGQLPSELYQGKSRPL